METIDRFHNRPKRTPNTDHLLITDQLTLTQPALKSELANSPRVALVRSYSNTTKPTNAKTGLPIEAIERLNNL